MDEKEREIITQTSPKSKHETASRRILTVEPIMFLAICFLGNVQTILGQYLERRIATDIYNYTLPNTSNVSCVTNATNRTSTIGHKIQSEASQWMLFINICSTFPPLISTVVIGAWSDIHGRKIALVLPVVGNILQCLSFIIVIAFNLPIEVLLVGAFAVGVSGSYPLLLTGCLSYIADITTDEQRTFRITMVEVTLAMAIASSQLSLGYFIKAEGFLSPCLLLLGLEILAFLYIIAPKFLIETVQKDDGASVYDQISSIWIDIRMLFKVNTDHRRWKLGLFGILSFALEIVVSGYVTVLILYTTGEPFCWTSAQVGIFISGTVLFQVICNTIAAKSLSKCMSDLSILQMCFTSLVVSMVIIGLAQTDLLLYVSSIVGCLRSLAPPVVRSIMSKTVAAHEQGVMFSFLSSAVGAAEFAAPIILNNIYSATVFFEPSLVFYRAAGIGVIPMVLTCIFRLFLHQSYEQLREHDEMDDGEIN